MFEDFFCKVFLQSVDVEELVFGGILFDINFFDCVVEVMGIDDFYCELYRKIFWVMLVLSEKNELVDLIMLIDMLCVQGDL